LNKIQLELSETEIDLLKSCQLLKPLEKTRFEKNAFKVLLSDNS